MIRRIKRWNKWRQHNTNCLFYQLLVFFGVYTSPSFDLTLTDIEEEAIHECIKRYLKDGGSNGR